MSQRVISVSELVTYLKRKLDQDSLIQNIAVQGEVSNFTNHRSGHWYFTLKDDASRISCVMFSSQVKNCKIIPKSGDKVFLVAKTSVFEASGQLQLYVSSMRLDGLGDYYVQFEELKKKLRNEGLFDKIHKKEIPPYPMKIALVTGNKTAAREDVLTTLANRWNVAEVVEYHTLVQGENAPIQIIEALSLADKSNCDVLLLVRGGGSIEDLWSFNDEALARAIFSCQTPVVVGVGHEIDVTIADYVADLRAPTPTGAALMSTPSLVDVFESLAKQRQHLHMILNHQILVAKKEMYNIKKSPVFTAPLSLIEMKWEKVDFMSKRLETYPKLIQNKRLNFEMLKSSLVSKTINTCHDTSNKVKSLHQRCVTITEKTLHYRRTEFMQSVIKLDAYSPLKSLSRGYVLSYQDNTLMTSLDDITMNEELSLIYSDGKLHVQPLKKEKKNG